MSAVAQVTAPNVSASLYIPAALAPCRGVVNVSAVTSAVLVYVPGAVGLAFALAISAALPAG